MDQAASNISFRKQGAAWLSWAEAWLRRGGLTKESADWLSSLRATVQRWLGARPVDASAEEHFGAKAPNWGSFHANLHRPEFQKAVERDPRADETLKKYVRTQTVIQESREPAASVAGERGTYRVQYQPKLGRHTCTCPDFQFRAFKDGAGKCKHIRQVEEAGGVRQWGSKEKTSAPAMDLRNPPMGSRGIPTEDSKGGAQAKLDASRTPGRVGNIATQRSIRASGPTVKQQVIQTVGGRLR